MILYHNFTVISKIDYTLCKTISSYNPVKLVKKFLIFIYFHPDKHNVLIIMQMVVRMMPVPMPVIILVNKINLFQKLYVC